MFNYLKDRHRNFLFFLSKTSILSLLLIIPLFFLVFNKIPVYKVNIEQKKNTLTNCKTFYQDLNSDGESELVRLLTSFPNKVSIIVESQYHQMLGQWNFEGLSFDPICFFADFDNDDSHEIILFNWKIDSIYIHCFNPYTGFNYSKAVAEHKKLYNEFDVSFSNPIFYDINCDGFKEIIFPIITGFSLNPRNLNILDIKNDVLITSPESNVNFFNPIVSDIDNDGNIEILVETSAYGNTDSTSVLSDQYCWFVIFDSFLNYKFQPKRIGQYPSNLQISFNSIDSTIYSLYLNSSQRNEPCILSIINNLGEIVKLREFKYTDGFFNSNLFSYKNEIYLFRNCNTIYKIDDDLNLSQMLKLPENCLPDFYASSLLDDKNCEMVFYSVDFRDIFIVKDNFKYIQKFEYNDHPINVPSFIRNKGKNKLYIQGNEYLKKYQFYINPYYYLKYPLIVLTYVIIYYLLYILRLIQGYTLEHQHRSKKQIIELQIKSIKNQIDPHFTLNILNSIGALYSNQDIETANYIFGKYCKLLRQSIMSSSEISNSIKDELKYVCNYLELEKYRLAKEMNYTISIGSDINQEYHIPKMLIFTFVENAIKHGIRAANKKGKIDIHFYNQVDIYQIRIKDNGIGRKVALMQTGFNTGRGLEILDKILNLYYSLNQIKITYRIVDLYNDNGSIGTKIEINIPIKETAGVNRWKKLVV